VSGEWTKPTSEYRTFLIFESIDLRLSVVELSWFFLAVLASWRFKFTPASLCASAVQDFPFAIRHSPFAFILAS
jgi:hypothetical protein